MLSARLQTALDFDHFEAWANALPEDWHTEERLHGWASHCPIAVYFRDQGVPAIVGVSIIRFGVESIPMPAMMYRVRRQIDARAARSQTNQMWKFDLISAIAQAKIEVGLFDEPDSARRPRGKYDKTGNHE